MKTTFFLLKLLIVGMLCLPTAFAQYEPYTQMGLPEGAIARFGKSSIREIIYSPDGTRLAVTTTIGVWIYDSRTGEELDLITGGHTDRVYSAAYSPDGKTIATTSRDETVKLWDAGTGKLQKTLTEHKSWVLSIAYSPDGNTLATGGVDDTIRLWNAHTGKYIKTLKGHTKDILSVMFSPDSKTIASSSNDGTIRFWDVERGQLKNTFKGYRELISYSPVGKAFLVLPNPDGGNTVFRTKDSDGYIRETVTLANPDTIYAMHILDAVTGQRIQTISSLNNVNCFAYSPDGNTIAISDGERFGLWNATTGKHQKTFIEDIHEVDSIAYSPDGKTIATASWDGTMRWWNVQTGENIKTFTGYINVGQIIKYSPNGKTIAISEGHKISLWNSTTGKHQTALKGHERSIIGFTFSPDGHTIATGSLDGTARLWDAHTGENIRILVKHTDSVDTPIRIDTPVYSPDGKTIAARSKHNWVWLWDAHTGKTIITIQGKFSHVRRFMFSPDGQILATKSRGKPVQLWDTTTGKNINTLMGHAWHIMFSPDGKTIAIYTDNMVQLWDTITGENITTLFAPNAYVTAVLHLRGKPFAITIYEDETVSLWDIALGHTIKTFERHGDGIQNLLTRAFLGRPNLEEIAPWDYTIECSPTGDTFATIAGDNPVRLWDIATGTQTGKPIRSLKGEKSYTIVKYSPDGRTIVTIPVGEDRFGGTVRLWDVGTGKHLKTLKGHSNCDYNSVAYSPDSKTIATGHRDGTVLLWDVPAR